MPLFRCSCILGGRCNQIKTNEDIPEISSNRNGSINGKAEGSNLVDENEMEQALLYLHRPCIGSLSLGMMVHRPGILIHRDLILTSHGNLPHFDAAVDAEFVLCYLPSSRRRRSIPPKTILTRRLEPHRFFLTSEALDLTLVACEAVPENIPEIIPLSIHQHLGSMDLLEVGHQVYVVGHLQGNEMRGILTSGSGRTTIFPWKDACNNTLVAFIREPKKDVSGLWMPGSAGFDEQGEFSFMVAKPQLSYTCNTSANNAQEGSFKRKSLETTTSNEIAQYGVPLYVIQDWMLMHGIRDLDNLPSPIQLSDSVSNKVTPTTTSSAARSIEESPLIPHGSLPLSDRNSISYVVMNSSHLVLESQPRRNSSPIESFISYEPSCIGNETPLQDTLTIGLGLNSIATTKEVDNLILKEKSFELPIIAIGEGKNHIISENLYEMLPLREVSTQDAASMHDLRRAISEKVPASRPLKWHSRTSLPSSLKTINIPTDEKRLDQDETTLPLPKFELNHDKKLNIDELHARLSSERFNQPPLLYEQHFDISSSNNGAPLRQMESDHDIKHSLINVSSDQVYEEISLETPKLTRAADKAKQIFAVLTSSLSDTCVIEEASEDGPRDKWVVKEACNTSYIEPDQKVPSVPMEIGSAEDKQELLTSHAEEQKWDNRMEPACQGMYSIDRIGDESDISKAKEQYVPITSNGDFKVVNEERRVLNRIMEGEKSEPNDGLLMFSEKSDAYVACDSAINVGAISNDGIALDVGASHIDNMLGRALNLGASPDDSMSERALNEGVQSDGGMKNKHQSSAPSASSTRMNSPLRPEEVSKRIQGYGNVSNIMQSANMKNASNKEERGGGRRGSGSGSVSGSGTSGPPLKSLFLDVGSSLVSGRWMKSSSNKAPSSDDKPT